MRLTDVYRFMIIAQSKAEYAVNKIGDVAKATGLLAVTEYGKFLLIQRLANKCRHHAAVVQTHAGSISIKDPDDLGIEPVKPMIGHGDGLSEPFSFIVHPARTDRIDVTPIVLILRVN